MGLDGALAELVAERHAERAASGPFVVGIAGAVAVGKSELAKRLADSLARASTVEVVATDAFLLPNRVLDARGLTQRKGFPESYDTEALVEFLGALRNRSSSVSVPVYSHATYDIVDGGRHEFPVPDVLVLEGVNVLRFADRLDLGVYVDAPEELIETWYVVRFEQLVDAARDDPGSFYAPWVSLPRSEVADLARATWRGINGVNLHDYIAPTRSFADVVVEKGPGHVIVAVRVGGP